MAKKDKKDKTEPMTMKEISKFLSDVQKINEAAEEGLPLSPELKDLQTRIHKARKEIEDEPIESVLDPEVLALQRKKNQERIDATRKAFAITPPDKDRLFFSTKKVKFGDEITGWELDSSDKAYVAMILSLQPEQLSDQALKFGCSVPDTLAAELTTSFDLHPNDGGLFVVPKGLPQLLPGTGKEVEVPSWLHDDLYPLVEPPSDDIERDCCDAKETFVVWWLTQHENKVINQGIRAGEIKLPHYIAHEIRRFEDCVTTGQVSIAPHFPMEIKEITDEYASDEHVEVNGIVIRTLDVRTVEKYCGILSTLEMESYSSTTHLAEELAIHNKPYTNDEIREKFLEHLRGLIEYWGDLHPTNGKEAASGITHSICAAISGNSMNLPGFALVPLATKEDNEYTSANGERPWPVVPPAILDTLPDGGGWLPESLYHPAEKPVAQCEFWLSKDEWRRGMQANKWAWCVEVLLTSTQFILDRYETEHPGTVLGDAYRDLCRIALKHGAYFVPDEWDVMDSSYSFKWVTDDPDVFEAMLNEMSGYTIRGHF